MELEEIIEQYSPREILEELDRDDIIEYCIAKFSAYDILREFDESDLIDNLPSNYLVFEDEDEVREYVEENDLISHVRLFEESTQPSMRMRDCIDLINEITQKEGWNYLYNLIEGQKQILNIL